jgi:hypothetical protein
MVAVDVNSVVYTTFQIGIAEASLCAIDGRTGMQLWSQALTSGLYSAPFLSKQGLLIASAYGILTAINLRTGSGTIAWQIPVPIAGGAAWDVCSEDPVSTTLYCIYGQQWNSGPFLAAVQPGNATLLWSVPVPAGQSQPGSANAPVIDSFGHVYVNSNSQTASTLYSINSTSGTPIWALPQSFVQYSLSVNVAGTVYFWGQDYGWQLLAVSDAEITQIYSDFYITGLPITIANDGSLLYVSAADTNAPELFVVGNEFTPDSLPCATFTLPANTISQVVIGIDGTAYVVGNAGVFALMPGLLPPPSLSATPASSLSVTPSPSPSMTPSPSPSMTPSPSSSPSQTIPSVPTPSSAGTSSSPPVPEGPAMSWSASNANNQRTNQLLHVSPAQHNVSFELSCTSTSTILRRWVSDMIHDAASSPVIGPDGTLYFVGEVIGV